MMFEATRQLLKEGTDCIDSQLCAGHDESELLDKQFRMAERELREAETTIRQILDDYDRRRATRRGRFQIWLARKTK